ncbi:MAG TPA: polysaccharide lyase family 7 protein [Polyangiaceae bacterium]|nr:polysaccharide lyase family 7 protein [Polyangiaceae bacterium]
MKHCVGLVSVGLCVLSFGCGSAAAGGGADSEGGSRAAGAAPTSGGAPSASAGASQGGAGASAGDSSLPSGGASQGGGTVSGMGGDSAGGAPSSAGGAQPVGGSAGRAGSGGAPGLDPNKPPGANFDLTRFTLQLPLSDGNGSVQQIKDLSVYTSDYFYTAPDGAMTFWCPVTGAHTMNTHYPRTELRENAVGGDWAISGTHSMTASFKVTKTPSSKGTIIGQVHGNATDGTSEILKLEWLTTNEIVASVEDNNSASQSDQSLGSYALNALLTYTIELENSQLTVSITDAKGAMKTVTSSYSASRWTQDSYYFKLGDYVQLDTGAATNGGRVSFYSFAIKHGS